MKIIIPGDPIPKMRARYTVRNGFVLTYDPQNDTKNNVIKILKNFITHQKRENLQELTEMAQGVFFDVALTFHIPVPKSDSISERNAKLWGIQPCNKKPDLDNLAKFYLDCMNKILYKDDCQITRLKAIKLYSELPKTEIVIMTNKKIVYSNPTGIVLQQFTPIMIQDFIKEMQNFRGMPYFNFDELQNESKIHILETFAEKICLFAEKYAAPLHKIKKQLELNV